MIKERIKSVGKKKVLGIATVFMLVGGGSALASEPGQSAMHGAIDTMFKKAVEYYVQNVDSTLEAFAEEQKGNIAGTVAGGVKSYMTELQAHYSKEVERGKLAIKKNKEQSINEGFNYSHSKYAESLNAVTNKVNEEVAEADAEIDALVAAEFEKAGNETNPQ